MERDTVLRVRGCRCTEQAGSLCFPPARRRRPVHLLRGRVVGLPGCHILWASRPTSAGDPGRTLYRLRRTVGIIGVEDMSNSKRETAPRANAAVVAAGKRVILSMGGKGGVGKTSVMAGLAEWFAANEIPVKLLD